MGSEARSLLIVLLIAAGQQADGGQDLRAEPRRLGQRLVGHWSLVSFEVSRGSQTEYPFGRDAIGQIIYEAAGHMAVQIMRTGRPAFVSGDQGAGTDAEIAAAFHGYVAYFGTYEVDGGAGVVTHHVAGSLFPNWVGGAQRREVLLDGDRLILSTSPILFQGEESVFRLIWRRME